MIRSMTATPTLHFTVDSSEMSLTTAGAAAANPATAYAVEVEHQAITAALDRELQLDPPTMAKVVQTVAANQAVPLEIVDIGGNRYPLPAPDWWATPGGDLVAMALAHHPALVEAGQRFKLVTADGNAIPATVPLLLAGRTPKAALIWIDNEDDAAAGPARPPARPAAGPQAKRQKFTSAEALFCHLGAC